jgi:uncharacterized protein (DUF433 family)
MGHPRITIDPNVMGGRACIVGTRVPVHVLLAHLGSGATMHDLLEGYPLLTEADVMAAMSCAADLVEHVGVVVA